MLVDVVFGTESQSRQGTFFPVNCGQSASTPPAVCCPCSQDLTAYKKFRNKEVSRSARSLIGLFRCACMPVYVHVGVPVHACLWGRQSWVQALRLPTMCRTLDTCGYTRLTAGWSTLPITAGSWRRACLRSGTAGGAQTWMRASCSTALHRCVLQMPSMAWLGLALSWGVGSCRLVMHF